MKALSVTKLRAFLKSIKVLYSTVPHIVWAFRTDEIAGAFEATPGCFAWNFTTDQTKVLAHFERSDYFCQSLTLTSARIEVCVVEPTSKRAIKERPF
jgi:hypothetical protein